MAQFRDNVPGAVASSGSVDENKLYLVSDYSSDNAIGHLLYALATRNIENLRYHLALPSSTSNIVYSRATVCKVKITSLSANKNKNTDGELGCTITMMLSLLCT